MCNTTYGETQHGMVIGLGWGADGPADPTATHCLLLQEIHIGFGFTNLLLAHRGSPRQNPDSHKTVVIAVVVYIYNCLRYQVKILHANENGYSHLSQTMKYVISSIMAATAVMETKTST